MNTSIRAAAFTLASSIALATSTVGCSPVTTPAASAPKHAVASIHRFPTRGRVVVLAFVGSWCPTSRAALPGLDALAAQRANARLLVLAVNEDASRDEADRFAAETGLQLPMAHDVGGRIAARFAPPTIPTILVLDPSGDVRFTHAGFHGADDLATIGREVDALLPDAPIETDEAPVINTVRSGEEVADDE